MRRRDVGVAATSWMMGVGVKPGGGSICSTAGMLLQPGSRLLMKVEGLRRGMSLYRIHSALWSSTRASVAISYVFVSVSAPPFLSIWTQAALLFFLK